MKQLAHYFTYTVLTLALVVPTMSCATQELSKPSPTPPLSTAEVVEGITEKVIIDGQEYLVPPPWAGNRLYAPEYTYESFKKIPVEFALNNSKVYVLAPAQPHLVALLEKARADGIDLKVESGYRSVSYQKRIFKRMFKKGRTFDDIVRYVAPPGYSQHMIGTAVDFHPSNWRFADTPQYPWLQQNADQFGFEETYSEQNSYKMPWEAWHWNYTGTSE